MKIILNNKKISIQITDSFINIIIGNKNKIYETQSITLDSGICVDGTVRNTAVVIKKLNEYLDVAAHDVKNVSFIVRGSDLITRNIEVPILKEEALREAVNFEFSQFIPDIEDYYTDYEIVEKINTKEKKAYKLMLVAASINKINPIVEIARGIGKELEVIDILSNSLARVLKSGNSTTVEESTGVFYFGADSSILTIIEDRILKFERNLPFGIKNIYSDAYEEVAATVTAIDSKEVTTLLKEDDQKRMSFENLLNSINNTIRYYNSERHNKPVGSFIVICADIFIENLEKYLEQSLDLPCILIREPGDVSLKVKFTENFPKFMATYGLLLREKNKKLINLNPEAINKEVSKANLDIALVRGTAITVIGVALLSIPLVVMNKVITKEISTMDADIARYTEIVDKNAELKASNASMERFINRIKGVEDNTSKTSVVLEKVNTHVPKEITFVSLSFADTGSINISGESYTYEAIADFLANLQMSDEFRNAKISYINPIEKSIEVSANDVNNSGIRNMSKLPLAMVGSFNVWNNTKLLASEGGTGKGETSSSVNGNNTNVDTGTNNNVNSNNSGSSNNSNGSNNSGTNDSKNTATRTVYSFAISIEGVSKDGSAN